MLGALVIRPPASSSSISTGRLSTRAATSPSRRTRFSWSAAPNRCRKWRSGGSLATARPRSWRAPFPRPDVLSRRTRSAGFSRSTIAGSCSARAPYRDIPEVLATLAARATLAVLTNKPLGPTREILDGLGLSVHFAAERVLGGDGPYPRKPDPAGLGHLCAEAGVSPGEAVLVGDSLIDWRTARAAGTRICLAGYGFGRDAGGRQAGVRGYRSATADARPCRRCGGGHTANPCHSAGASLRSAGQSHRSRARRGAPQPGDRRRRVSSTHGQMRRAVGRNNWCGRCVQLLPDQESRRDGRRRRGRDQRRGAGRAGEATT